jgi:hypothetical protein
MISEICARHRVSLSAFYRHRKRGGWLTRKAPVRRSAYRDLARRLFTALDRKVTEFESRLTEGAASSADSERDARTLNTLVRLFDKLQDYDVKAAKAANAGKAGKDASAIYSAPASKAVNAEIAHDSDRLRHDLAQRLEKLRAGIGG